MGRGGGGGGGGAKFGLAREGCGDEDVDDVEGFVPRAARLWIHLSVPLSLNGMF